MSRPWKILLILLGIQAGISAAAAALDWTYSCGACRTGGFSLGPVGVAFYAGLLLAALYAGPGRLVFGAVIFAFGIHVMLVAQLLSLGLACWICFAAAANALAMAVLSVACDRANLARAAAILPWSAILVVGWRHIPLHETAKETEATASEAVRLTAFTQPECPYCEDLRDRVFPALRKEFGPRVRIVERPAGEQPGLRRVPTLVISPAGRDAGSRVIEGLPDYETLRGALLRAEGKP